MFNPVTIPFGCKMLFNVVTLKEGVTMEDVELALGEMCNTVKNTYGHGGGFIAGQVYEYAGFISDEGTVSDNEQINPTPPHIVIVTYWNSFEEHEKSHADTVFKEKFEALGKLAESTYELGYSMLWQGDPSE
jgi:hypothetical protein